MENNYFTVEHNGTCVEHVVITNNSGETMFENFMNMSYDEMKACNELDSFVATVMETSEAQLGNDKDKNTIITLIDSEDVFIWSIIMGPGEGDDIRYSLVDWRKDGKLYRYEN